MWLNTTQVQQMAGRAGRAGLDTEGEVIMLCPPRCKDLAPYANLLRVSCICESCKASWGEMSVFNGEVYPFESKSQEANAWFRFGRVCAFSL